MTRIRFLPLLLLALLVSAPGCGGGAGSGVAPAPLAGGSAGAGGVPFEASFFVASSVPSTAPSPETVPSEPSRAAVRQAFSFARVTVNGIERGFTDASGRLVTALDRVALAGTLEVVAVRGATRIECEFRVGPESPASRVALEVEVLSESSLRYDIALRDGAGTAFGHLRGTGRVAIAGVLPGEGGEPGGGGTGGGTGGGDTGGGGSVPAGAPLIVTFLDVGQGDAALVEFPTGEFMVIDAADSSSGSDRVAGSVALPAAFARKGRTRVDWALLTHPHDDHIGGFPHLLNSYPVGQVLDSGTVHTTVVFSRYLQAIGANAVPYNTVAEGDTIRFGTSCEVRILQRAGRYAATDLNNNSLVVKIVYDQIAFLFTGDIEREAQVSLNARHRAKEIDLSSTVIKVPHHGSNTSHDQTFIKNVSAELAVISVGAGNRYGHPSPVTLDRYAAVGTRTVRTDLSGTVTVVTNGTRITTTTER